MTNIWTDGGTGCNIPALGYGEGYGSYRINAEPIVRLRFGQAMSNNAAEVNTIVAALSEVSPLEHVTLYSDSQIALKWVNQFCNSGNQTSPSGSSSTEFLASLRALSDVCTFRTITTRWVPRAEIVLIFGH